MADRIRVLIVDDIPETRDHLAKLLGFEPDIEVIGAAASGADAIELDFKTDAQSVHDTLKDRATLARTIASADVVLHGSSAETYGFAVAEALCCGTPVVVPSTGGAADLADPTCSEIYPAGDADAAARALIALLERDRAGLSRAAALAADRIGDIESHFEKLFALYAAAVDHRRAAKRKEGAL